MTKDEISELRRCAEELGAWLNRGNLNDVPLETIRTISRLAHRAVNTIETMTAARNRSWLFDDPSRRR